MAFQSAIKVKIERISRPLTILCIGILCLAPLTATTFVKSRRAMPSTVIDVSQNTNKKAQTSTVVSNLTRFGFEPSAMKIPAGRCFFAIRNLIGKEQIDVQIKQSDNSAVLFADKQIKGKSHWEKSLEFSVGEYVITEAGNPDWTFQLSVVPATGQ